ncbi:unnamed protein product [Nippostrongylus brasiliensis]|uniref:DUF2188 domain-containing protein n=1 Tax=Nippostrongylus brasiliensis TaxID=27835 RepID=A0A0N4Y677_NIPBR|nr:unnamed protein product [Nippostrongylus brasiliensis]
MWLTPPSRVIHRGGRRGPPHRDGAVEVTEYYSLRKADPSLSSATVGFSSSWNRPYGRAGNAPAGYRGTDMLDQQKNTLSIAHTTICRFGRPVKGEISGCAVRHGLWTVTTHLEHDMDCFTLCAYNARTASSNAHLYALLKAAGHMKHHAIALQEAKSRKADIRQHDDGTPAIRGEKIRRRWR